MTLELMIIIYYQFQSLETKNIKPHDYLSESLERHRALSMSPLRENLKVNERDVNQQWNAAPRPGPKVKAQSFILIEVRKQIDTI